MFTPYFVKEVFMKCSLCGRTVRTDCSNWVEKDGKIYHKKCPSDKKQTDGSLHKQLMDRVNYHLNMNPSDWLKNSGLNFQKVAMQVDNLKKRGYSYEEQLYALDYLVEMKGVFYGYTHVVNNIAWIIDKKKLQEEKLAIVDLNKSESNNGNIDLSSLINEGDGWL